MKRTKEISKKRLFIEELERPAPAALFSKVTTQAADEESLKGGVTTLAIGEETGTA